MKAEQAQHDEELKKREAELAALQDGAGENEAKRAELENEIAKEKEISAWRVWS